MSPAILIPPFSEEDARWQAYCGEKDCMVQRHGDSFWWMSPLTDDKLEALTAVKEHNATRHKPVEFPCAFCGEPACFYNPGIDGKDIDFCPRCSEIVMRMERPPKLKSREGLKDPGMKIEAGGVHTFLRFIRSLRRVHRCDGA